MDMRVDDDLEIHRDHDFFMHVYHIRYKGRKVGFLSFLNMGDTCYINQFELDKRFHNMRIGTRVYRFFEQEIVSPAIREIECTSMTYASGFWGKMGFIKGDEKGESVMMMKRVNLTGDK